MSHDEIARNFAQFYYQTFARSRPSLSALYQPQSMLTMEGTPCQGPASIVEKLAALPELAADQPYSLDTLDAQPSNGQGGVLIFVTGTMRVAGETVPLRFSQTFQLMPNGTSYFVLNDIFRLNYG